MVLRIFKMIATSGFLTASECTEFVFDRALPEPNWGSLQCSPDPLAGLRSPTSKWEEREEEGKREKRGEEGDERDCPPHLQIPGFAPDAIVNGFDWPHYSKFWKKM